MFAGKFDKTRKPVCRPNLHSIPRNQDLQSSLMIISLTVELSRGISWITQFFCLGTDTYRINHNRHFLNILEVIPLYESFCPLVIVS